MKVMVDEDVSKKLIVYTSSGWAKLTDICKGEPFINASVKKPALLVRQHTDGRPDRFCIFTDNSKRVSVLLPKADARAFATALKQLKLENYEQKQGDT